MLYFNLALTKFQFAIDPSRLTFPFEHPKKKGISNYLEED
jgi:hypothetical protein